LAACGSGLLIALGPARRALPELCAKVGATRVFAQRGLEPGARAQEAGVAAALPVPLELYDGETLVPPGSLRTASGSPFSVSTPFARAVFAGPPLGPVRPAPEALSAWSGASALGSLGVPSLVELGLRRNERVLAGGEAAARARLQTFLRAQAERYDSQR